MTSRAAPVHLTIAPSDLTYLLLGCYRCFYDKVIAGVRQPVSIPRVFTTMDQQQRAHFDGEPATAIDDSLPAGTVSCADSRVRSAPILLREGRVAVTFKGAIDALIEFDDGTFGLVDFKTIVPDGRHVDQYVLQLHAYAWGLERPAAPDAVVAPIVKLGLLCFEPIELTEDAAGLAFRTTKTWLAYERDDGGFAAILDIVGAVLELDHAPPPSTRCHWCRYRDMAKNR